MEMIQNILSATSLIAGIFFMTTGSIGIVRLPDFYARTHAVSKSDTLGIAFSILGLVIYFGLSIITIKLIFILILVLLANPIGTHALGRAAYKNNYKPVLTGKSERRHHDLAD